jgi:thiol-disulfide isomerase/thioredoxin
LALALAVSALFFTSAAPGLASPPAPDKNPAVAAGDTPPAMVLGLTRRGEEVSVEKYPGTVRVVTFWASWCGPCRKEIVMLDKLGELAKDKLKVLAINIEDRQTFKEVTRQFFQSHVVMANDQSKRAHNAYGVNGIPHLVIIGRDGKVAKVKRGYSEEALPGQLKELDEEIRKGG